MTMAELYQIPKKALNIVCYNARSYFYKQDDILPLVLLSDICIINESWLKPRLPSSMIHVNAYNVVRIDRRPFVKKKGGGLLIYVKDIYKFVIDQQFTLIDRHGEFISITFFVHETKYRIIAVYRPPDANFTFIYEKISEMLVNEHHNRKIIIMGDFNIDVGIPAINNKYCIPFCTKHNLTQLINEPTRVDPVKGTATTIDHIYTNVNNVKQSGLINFHLTDHVPIYLSIKSTRNKIVMVPLYIRSYRRYDKTDFIMRLRQADWSHFTYEHEPDRLWQIMLGIIEKCLSFTAPIRRCYVSKNTPAWLTNIIIAQMRERDQLFRHAKNTKSLDDWRIANNQKNRVSSLLYYSKKDNISSLLERYKEEPTKFWDAIKKLLPKDCGTSRIILTNELDGSMVSDEDCPDYINRFFLRHW